jgi:hypothetical protein
MATNKMKIGTLTVEAILKMEAKIRRDEEIQTGMRINHHRVEKSKKTYNRKDKHKMKYAA